MQAADGMLPFSRTFGAPAVEDYYLPQHGITRKEIQEAWYERFLIQKRFIGALCG